MTFGAERKASISAANVRSDSGHFSESTTVLKATIETEESAVRDNSSSCLRDHRLGVNKSDHGLMHDLSPRS